MPHKQLFFPDDIDRINTKYFREIRENGAPTADPSYWYSNYSTAALEAGLDGIKQYRSDYQAGLKNEKPVLLNALALWDGCEYAYDDVTFCSSATSASFILLCYAKSILGIDNIYFETPCYFASLRQSQFLGLNSVRIPTYFSSDFVLDIENLPMDKPKIIWLTQPRFGLGQNQSADDIGRILSRCGRKDLLVIDEATEQLTPPPLHACHFKTDERILKIRSPFKGVGVNGPRISSIIHGVRHRSAIQNVLEQVQGALDVFSLEFALNVLSDDARYSAMLAAANRQVVQLHKKLCTWSLGTRISPSRMENGYIGSIALDYGKSDLAYTRKRELLLKHCSDHRMPVILGANLNFARDDHHEFIRINYFNAETDLKKSIRILDSFSI